MLVSEIICSRCHARTPRAPRCGSCGQEPILNGRYCLLEVKGSGSFGTTYRAERTDDAQVLAVKEIVVRRVESLKVLELFEREAKVLEQLSHPGIPRYFEDFVEESGRDISLFLVQEFIEGSSLGAKMGVPMRTEFVFETCARVLDILVYLQGFSPPVVHRDIKPHNVMIRPDGSVALIDFGSVRAALDMGGSTVAGTFGYMAPEQFQGRALPQTDVYGVGAMAVALLSGQDPQQLVKDDRTLAIERLNLPQPFHHVLAGMLTSTPESRFGPSEALDAIRTALSGDMPLARALGPDQLVLGDRPRKVPVAIRHTIEERKQTSTMLGFSLFAIPLMMSAMLAAFSFLGMPMAWQLFAAMGFFGGIFGLFGVGIPLRARSVAKMNIELWEMGRPIKVKLDKIDRSRTSTGRPFTSVYYSYEWNGKAYKGHWYAVGKCSWKVNQHVDALILEETPSKSTLIPPPDLEDDY